MLIIRYQSKESYSIHLSRGVKRLSFVVFVGKNSHISLLRTVKIIGYCPASLSKNCQQDERDSESPLTFRKDCMQIPVKILTKRYWVRKKSNNLAVRSTKSHFEDSAESLTIYPVLSLYKRAPWSNVPTKWLGKKPAGPEESIHTKTVLTPWHWCWSPSARAHGSEKVQRIRQPKPSSSQHGHIGSEGSRCCSVYRSPWPQIECSHSELGNSKREDRSLNYGTVIADSGLQEPHNGERCCEISCDRADPCEKSISGNEIPWKTRCGVVW